MESAWCARRGSATSGQDQIVLRFGRTLLLFATAMLVGPGCSAFRADVGLGVGFGAEIELPVVLHTGLAGSGFYYVGHDYHRGWRAGNTTTHLDESGALLFVHYADEYGSGNHHECMGFFPIWTSREKDPTEWQPLEVRVYALFVALRLGWNPWNWFAAEKPPPETAKAPPVLEPPERSHWDSFQIVRGISLFEAGDFQAAIRELTAGVAERPSPNGWYYLGLAYARTGQHIQAVRCYDEALKLEPRLNRVYPARGISNFLSGRFDEAIADCDRAIAKEPGTPGFYVLRGRARASLPSPDLDSAIADFSKALELKPNDPDALVGRLDAYIRKGDVKSAETEFLRLQSLGIPMPDPIRLWGTAMGLTPAPETEEKENPEEDSLLDDFFKNWEAELEEASRARKSPTKEPPQAEEPESKP